MKKFNRKYQLAIDGYGYCEGEILSFTNVTAKQFWEMKANMEANIKKQEHDLSDSFSVTSFTHRYEDHHLTSTTWQFTMGLTTVTLIMHECDEGYVFNH